jgi:ornithine cyclodeaminase/alanine dehydrogenase-like protein (mu-crystallin family)
MGTGFESNQLRATQTAAGTLLLARGDVERLLAPDVCIAAVEDAFRRHALGTAPSPGILGMQDGDGSFHVKAAFLDPGPAFFAAKINANFPQNAARHGLPTIQGVLALFDAANGMPLALMDSMAITALRTAAATAVAAKHLSREESRAALICGCGGQAPAQLRALLRVRAPSRVFAFDQVAEKARAFAAALASECAVEIVPVTDLGAAVSASDIIITCTTSKRFFVSRDMVKPGAFIAAVGADNEDKQEIDPQLLARCTLVTDLTRQCAAIGDLHHAIAAGVMTGDDVHAELGEIVAGLKPARSGREEITVFDSTGTALQDVAAAIAVYRRAHPLPGGERFHFNV